MPGQLLPCCESQPGDACSNACSRLAQPNHPARPCPTRRPSPQVAVAMEKEGMVSRAEAVLMVEPRHLDQLLHPMFQGVDKPEYKKAVLGKGLPASPGAAMGRIVFTADDAEKWDKEGEKVGLWGRVGTAQGRVGTAQRRPGQEKACYNQAGRQASMQPFQESAGAAS